MGISAAGGWLSFASVAESCVSAADAAGLAPTPALQMLVIADVLELELGAGGSTVGLGDDALGGVGVTGVFGVGRTRLLVFFVAGVGCCPWGFAGALAWPACPPLPSVLVVSWGGVAVFAVVVERVGVLLRGGVAVIVQFFAGDSPVLCWAGSPLVTAVQRGSPVPTGAVAVSDVLGVGLAAADGVGRTGVTGPDAAPARPAASISDHPVTAIETASVVAIPANRERGDRRSHPDVLGRVTGQASGLLL
jgi:hypothetical protein